MTDRELLKQAARAAANISPEFDQSESWWDGYLSQWNPLIDDGDALRLAVKVLNWPHGGRAFDSAVGWMYAIKQLPKDPYEATRRAIVLAAAEIGRQR